MGYLDLLLGANNPLAHWVDSNPYTMSAVGSGLASGQNFSDGLAAAAQGANAARASDNAYATSQATLAKQQDAINKTADFLHQKGRDDLAAIAQAGQGGVALTQYFASQKPLVMSPGQTAFDMSSNKPVFTAPPNPTVGNTPADLQNYAFYSKQETDAGRKPKSFLDYQTSLKNAGSTNISLGTADPSNPNTMPPVGLDSNGQPSADQQAAYLKQFNPGTQQLLKDIVTYKADPTKIASLKGGDRQALIQAAMQLDPTFDQAQYTTRANMLKSVTSGSMSNTLNFVNTSIQHLKTLDDQISGLGNFSSGQFGPLTSMANSMHDAYNSATQNPARNTFQQTAQAASNELAKFFKGVGATDQAGIAEWQSAIASAKSPEELHAAVQNAITNLLQPKLDTIQQQYKAVMGGKVLPGFLTPDSVDALKKLGIDPGALDPAPDAGGNATYTYNPATGNLE